MWTKYQEKFYEHFGASVEYEMKDISNKSPWGILAIAEAQLFRGCNEQL